MCYLDSTMRPFVQQLVVASSLRNHVNFFTPDRNCQGVRIVKLMIQTFVFADASSFISVCTIDYFLQSYKTNYNPLQIFFGILKFNNWVNFYKLNKFSQKIENILVPYIVFYLQTSTNRALQIVSSFNNDVRYLFWT